MENLTVATVFMQVSRLPATTKPSLCQEPWTSVRGANVMAFAAGVLMLVAACGSSPQMPTAGPTTLGTAPSSATGSTPTSAANGPTSTTASTAPTSTPAIPPASTSAPTALVP